MKKTKLAFPRMDRIANFLNQRNAREKYMLVVFFGVFVLTLDYFVWLGPVFKSFGELAPKLSPLKEEVRSLEDDHKNKALIEKRRDSAFAELEERQKFFVANDGTPALLESLSKLAQKSGVRISSVEPLDAGKLAAKASYLPFPIRVKAQAGTHELGAFLSQLETGKPFYRVKDMRIAANPLNERKHSVELLMDAFRRDK